MWVELIADVLMALFSSVDEQASRRYAWTVLILILVTLGALLGFALFYFR